MPSTERLPAMGTEMKPFSLTRSGPDNSGVSKTVTFMRSPAEIGNGCATADGTEAAEGGVAVCDHAGMLTTNRTRPIKTGVELNFTRKTPLRILMLGQLSVVAAVGVLLAVFRR